MVLPRLRDNYQTADLQLHLKTETPNRICASRNHFLLGDALNFKPGGGEAICLVTEAASWDADSPSSSRCERRLSAGSTDDTGQK